MPLRSHDIRIQRRPLWLLACGFGAVVLVLLISGVLLLRAIDLVGADARRLSGQQLDQLALIDKLQYEQAAVGELLYSMVRDPGRQRAGMHRAESQRLREAVQALVNQTPRQKLQPDEQAAWRDLEDAAQLLFDSMEGSLKGDAAAHEQMGLNHRRFVATVARLLDTSYQDARLLRAEEMRRFANHFTESAALLGGAVTLAIAGAVGSLIFTFRLFGKLERQAKTLRELALHILDEQEQSARRFSQELHDEFGQTLNAIEATLSVVRADSADGKVRLEDAKSMVKDSIANAREMARLLRPSILDDFGLDASLRELAQGFSQRTGIVVDYNSTVRERLAPQLETHLYRIAQEALTNVSRHSSARRVSIDLKTVTGTLILRIQDDGGGLPPRGTSSPPLRSLGLIGMAERANAAGGKFQLHNRPGSGVEIVVEAPVKSEDTEE